MWNQAQFKTNVECLLIERDYLVILSENYSKILNDNYFDLITNFETFIFKHKPFKTFCKLDVLSYIVL